MGLYTYALKKFVTIPKILEYKNFVFIGAHPDDIECGCGATVAKLTKLNKRVTFIIVTDGRYGTNDTSMSCEEIVSIRKEETRASAKVLGVRDIRFLEFSDGGSYDVNNVANILASELANIDPDLVFTIDNHVKSEIHPDHIQVGRASELAFFKCSIPLMMKELGLDKTANPKGIAYYFTDCPNIFINVTKTFKDKIRSIKEHKSQFSNDGKSMASLDDIISFNKFLAIRFGLRKFCRYGEGFRVLSNEHTHCMPDASKF